MQSNSTFKRLRDALQQGIYRIINPMVHGMIKAGMTPNTVTTIGLLGNIAAAGIFVAAGLMSEGTATVAGTVIETFNYHWGLVTLAGAVIILFSLFDMLDGQVARLGNMASRYGALYDSTLDRYCELLTLGGIAYYMMMIEQPLGALIAFVALVGSVMVSYVRARAEGLGIQCRIHAASRTCGGNQRRRPGRRYHRPGRQRTGGNHHPGGCHRHHRRLCKHHRFHAPGTLPP